GWWPQRGGILSRHLLALASTKSLRTSLMNLVAALGTCVWPLRISFNGIILPGFAGGECPSVAASQHEPRLLHSLNHDYALGVTQYLLGNALVGRSHDLAQGCGGGFHAGLDFGGIFGIVS